MGPKVRFLQKQTVGRPATFEKVETFSKMGGNLNKIKSNCSCMYSGRKYSFFNLNKIGQLVAHCANLTTQDNRQQQTLVTYILYPSLHRVHYRLIIKINFSTTFLDSLMAYFRREVGLLNIEYLWDHNKLLSIHIAY